jgi:chemotaxis protein MotB
MSDDIIELTPRTRWKLGLFAFLMTCAAGGAGYYAWQLQKTSSSERDGLKAHAHDVESALAKAEGGLAASQQELSELHKWKEETAKRLQSFREVSKKLQKMADAGKLGVRVRDGRLVMRMPQDVLFASGSATLSREGELNLMELKNVYKDNWELSMARALVVTRFLVEAKMKPENIVTAGYGEFDPIAKNATPTGRQENRRIEIILLPDLSELPRLPDDLAQAGSPEK